MKKHRARKGFTKLDHSLLREWAEKKLSGNEVHLAVSILSLRFNGAAEWKAPLHALADLTGWHRSKVRYHLARLGEKGVFHIQKSRERKAWLYALLPTTESGPTVRTTESGPMVRTSDSEVEASEFRTSDSGASGPKVQTRIWSDGSDHYKNIRTNDVRNARTRASTVGKENKNDDEKVTAPDNKNNDDENIPGDDLLSYQLNGVIKNPRLAQKLVRNYNLDCIRHVIEAHNSGAFKDKDNPAAFVVWCIQHEVWPLKSKKPLRTEDVYRCLSSREEDPIWGKRARKN